MGVSLQGIGSLCGQESCSSIDSYLNIYTPPEYQHYPDYLHTYYIYISGYTKRFFFNIKKSSGIFMALD